MAGNHRRNRKRLRRGKLNERSIARHYISLASDGTIIDGHLRAMYFQEASSWDASRATVTHYGFAGEIRPVTFDPETRVYTDWHQDHEGYANELLERHYDMRTRQTIYVLCASASEFRRLIENLGPQAGWSDLRWLSSADAIRGMYGMPYMLAGQWWRHAEVVGILDMIVQNQMYDVGLDHPGHPLDRPVSIIARYCDRNDAIAYFEADGSLTIVAAHLIDLTGLRARYPDDYDDQNPEATKVMREVEQQATLEEQGILPPLEASMARWEALIEETRAMGEQEQC